MHLDLEYSFFSDILYPSVLSRSENYKILRQIHKQTGTNKVDQSTET